MWPAAQPHTHSSRCLLRVVTVLCACVQYYTNRYYAQVGGVTLAELNRLELELLDRLGYRAHVDVPELCACLQVMVLAGAHARCPASQL
jgi:hypothetical protein